MPETIYVYDGSSPVKPYREETLLHGSRADLEDARRVPVSSPESVRFLGTVHSIPESVKALLNGGEYYAYFRQGAPVERQNPDGSIVTVTSSPQLVAITSRVKKGYSGQMELFNN